MFLSAATELRTVPRPDTPTWQIADAAPQGRPRRRGQPGPRDARPGSSAGGVRHTPPPSRRRRQPWLHVLRSAASAARIVKSEQLISMGWGGRRESGMLRQSGHQRGCRKCRQYATPVEITWTATHTSALAASLSMASLRMSSASRRASSSLCRSSDSSSGCDEKDDERCGRGDPGISCASDATDNREPNKTRCLSSPLSELRPRHCMNMAADADDCV